jgi:hypothetical protein
MLPTLLSPASRFRQGVIGKLLMEPLDTPGEIR